MHMVVLALDRDRRTVLARFALRSSAEATRLGVGISQAVTAWRRSHKIEVDPTTTVEGQDAIVSFRLPPGRVESMLTRIENLHPTAQQSIAVGR